MITFILLFFVAFIGLWATFIHFDKERIRRHLHEGGKAVSILWRPFGHGWTSETLRYGDGNRIYEVQYRDSTGSLRHVWCKTSMLSGVALAGDSVIATTLPTDSTPGTEVRNSSRGLN